MSETIQVQIRNPAKFFEIAKKDYSNWQRAWVREVVQNSYDAGSKNITIRTGKDEHGYYIECVDDGCGMTKDILVNKFFALGESGKNFENNTVGGFGKAKELIVFCHPRYTIHTNNIFVGPGCGGEEVKINECEPINGTIIRIWPSSKKDSSEVNDIIYEAKTYLNMCSLEGVNVKTYDHWYNKSIEYEPFDPGFKKVSNSEFDLYVKNKDNFDKSSWHLQGYMIVRVSGVAMYTRRLFRFPGMATVELKGPSYKLINANRDGVKYSLRSKIDSIIKEFTINPKSAGRDSSGITTKVFLNDGLITPDIKSQIKNKSIGEINWNNFNDQRVFMEAINVLIENSGPIPGFKNTFMIRHSKNSRMMKWGRKAAYLAFLWAKIVKQVYSAAGFQEPFGVGFVFNKDVKAEYALVKGVCYYLINPKQLPKLKDKVLLVSRMIDSAIHEISHTEFKDHNEYFVLEMHRIREKFLSSKEKIQHVFSEEYYKV